MRRLCVLCVLALALGGCGSGSSNAPAAKGPPVFSIPTLTISGPESVPSTVLVEMAREWGKANNIAVNASLLPLDKYAPKILSDFAAKRSDCDLIIGDSQWTGKGASDGHYLELTDWMSAWLKLDEFEPAALQGFCEYPAGSGKYFAAPCSIDACGFAYRKDLFEDPKEKLAFTAKYSRELAPPKTWSELRDIVEFFNRPQAKLYGVSVFTDDKYDAVTMGFQQVLWAWGVSYSDPKTFKVEGVLNSKEPVEALQFYADLCKCGPPASSHVDRAESLEAYTSGQVAMAMNFFSRMAALSDPKTCKYSEQTGYFAMPAGPGGKAFSSVDGQSLSISKYSIPAKQELAKKFIKWFHQAENQKRWAATPGCYSANLKALDEAEFLKVAPFNPAFRASRELLCDFYTIPDAPELLKSSQRHWHFVVIGRETAKDAMDALAKEHSDILKTAGLLKP